MVHVKLQTSACAHAIQTLEYAPRTHTHCGTHAHALRYARTRIATCTHACAPRHARTHTVARMCARIHTHTHTHIKQSKTTSCHSLIRGHAAWHLAWFANSGLWACADSGVRCGHPKSHVDQGHKRWLTCD